ncbi:LCP family protein [Caldalkalibacillus mannanilyticus]|uniref:LCP family protein n=1 Tax=Caldalkalibacillus mannanilyticus TaxID=1418 RepID=UPI0004695E56|nr:LCP family protein [Caldalkalibacillus mannanilyticus]
MKRKQLILRGLVTFMIVSLMGAGVLYYVYLQMINSVTNDDSNQPQVEDKISVVEERMDPFILLLYGIDERPELHDAGRPDTLMLALVDPEQVKVSLISIPRDSYVQIPGRKNKEKINHAYPLGGHELTIQTIEEWLGVSIYGHVAIDFNGFKELVDLVGGVDVYVDRSIIYDAYSDGTHIRLSKGQQVLDGKNALDFVRARLDNRGPRYYTSDYQRMERQQMVLKELGNKLLSFQSLMKIFEIQKIMGDNISTSLTAKELDKLIRTFVSFNMSNLETTSIQGNALRLGGVWYEDVPEEEIERIQTLIGSFLDRHATLADEREKQPESDSDEKSNNNG